MKVIILLLITFALARGAYSEEPCVKESLTFAACVNNAIVTHSGATKSREELQQAALNGCQNETKAYEKCGQIDKAGYAQSFIQSRIELFKKDQARIVVDSGNLETSDVRTQ